MNNKNKNYRVMKFLEPVNKKDKSKGYIRLDIRGIRGSIIVSVENLGDSKSNSEVYLYKDKHDRIKVGTVNNKKGMIKRSLSLSNSDSNIEDYNVCGVVNNKKIVLYATLFNAVSHSDIKKLEQVDENESITIEEEIEKEEVAEKAEELEMDCNKESVKAEKRKTETSKIDELLSSNKSQEDEEDNEFEQSEHAEKEKEKDKEIEKEKEKEKEKDKEKDKDEYEYQTYRAIDKEEINQDDVESASRGNQRKQYKNKFEENLFNVLKDFEKVDPLSVDIKGLYWWKINHSDTAANKGILPYYNQIISTYYPYPVANRITTCHNLMRKYGYYIFGVYKEDDEIKKLVYGVPGEFKREEQPYKGITGFKNWSYKNKDIKGEYGFWLAFVDSNTGEVSVPPHLEDN